MDAAERIHPEKSRSDDRTRQKPLVATSASIATYPKPGRDYASVRPPYRCFTNNVATSSSSVSSGAAANVGEPVQDETDFRRGGTLRHGSRHQQASARGIDIVGLG